MGGGYDQGEGAALSTAEQPTVLPIVAMWEFGLHVTKHLFADGEWKFGLL